jgi:hypothetical protein
MAAVQAQTNQVYKVSNLSVDVRAKDAVAAKNRALVQAKRQALHAVLRRITPFNSSDRFPPVQSAALDDMLEGFSVQRERNSPTRYIATLDFTFNPDEVKKLLSKANIAVIDQPSELVAVLPVYIEKGAINHTGRDPWRLAWTGLDLAHAIVPVKLIRTGPSLTMGKLSALLGGDVRGFVELRDKVKADKLVLAIAEPTADGKTLTTRLYGVDWVGSVGLTRHDMIESGDMKATAAYAASVALGVLEGRWKLVQSLVGAADGGGELAAIDMHVVFSGMGEWKDIRSRLVQVPGVNGLDVKSLSARSAHIGLQFPGGAERLAQAISSQGLSMEGGEGSWVLRSN